MFEVWCRVQESTYELGWKMNCWWIYVATLAERQLDTTVPVVSRCQLVEIL